MGALVQEKTDAQGRVSLVSKLNFFNMGKKEPWVETLHQAGYPKVDVSNLKPLFEYLELCLQQVCADNELGALLKGLEGEYVLPGPGGDPIRNPDVLPTGKNIHALDPQSIPTAAAVESAKIVVDRLLARNKAENDGKSQKPLLASFGEPITSKLTVNP